MQEFFKVSAVEDTIGGGLGIVDDKFVLRDGLRGGGLGLSWK